ncbi:hypothetical protein KFE98_21400 [bacterium SCSIO 12741]|nr:hypothetical protein KFE98_21400 [bacterium SCSIO 12741]
MIYRIRVLLDTEEDVFRDIEIQGSSTFEQFHQEIIRAFGWQAEEMASFYESNENWDKGKEIPLMDIQEEFGPEKLATMSEAKVEDYLHHVGDKMLYVFDFFLMWCFYLDVVAIKAPSSSQTYPWVAVSYGDAPAQHEKEPVDFGGSEPESNGDDEDDKSGPYDFNFDDLIEN